MAHNQKRSEAPLSPRADSCQFETYPRFHNNTRTVSEQAGRYQRKERGSRLLELLLPKGKGVFEDLDPCYWRRSCKLVVENFQNAILLSDNLLNCLPRVQRRCAVGLASGEESQGESSTRRNTMPNKQTRLSGRNCPRE